jgi:hypothetical protein
MSIGLDLKPIVTDSYKKMKCGDCIHQERAPRPPGKPIDLKEPVVLLCRERPPQIVYVIMQQPNGQPSPMPMGSMYCMVDHNYPACSQFKPINRDG